MNKTFFHITCTGYGTSQKNIRMLHLWSDVFSTHGEIFYYGTVNDNSSSTVVDIERGTIPNTITVNRYPGTSNEIVGILESAKDEIFELYESLCRIYPERKAFTIDVVTRKEVTEESFKRYIINPKNQYEMFIFRDFSKGTRLPNQIYLLETKNTEEFMETIAAQAWASHWVFPPVEKSTDIGKYFTYLLVTSAIQGKLVKRVGHSLKNTEIPALPSTEIASFYNTKAIEKLGESCGANNIQMVGGKYIDKNGTTDAPDDYKSVFTDETGMKSLEDKMVKDIINKGSLNYSDIICFGITETMRLIKTDSIIPINMDIHGLARKAVIFAGFVYVIPWDSSQEVYGSLHDDVEDYLIISTEESLPKRLM